MKLIKTVVAIWLCFSTFSIKAAQLPSIIESHFNAAVFNMKTGRMEAAEFLATKAVDSAETSNDSSLIAYSYGRYGSLLFDMRKIRGANTYLRKSLQMFLQLPNSTQYLPPVLKKYNALLEDFYRDSNPIIDANGLVYSDDLRNLLYLYTDKLAVTDTITKAKNNADEIGKALINGFNGIENSMKISEKDTTGISKTIKMLESAINLFYKNNLFSTELFPLENRLQELYDLSKPMPQLNQFGGIEIGSKGVKATVVRLNIDITGNEVNYATRFDTSINTDFTSFTDRSFNETVAAFALLKKILSERFLIADDNQFYAVSGGVVSQAEIQNQTARLPKLQSAIRQAINNMNKDVALLDGCKEAELSHMGIVRYEYRMSSALIDIGSGNTKGGYFPDVNASLKCFLFPHGSKSLANIIKSDSIKRYFALLKQAVDAFRRDSISPAFNAISPIRNKPNIVLSGGICWAIATITKPETLDMAYVTITRNEVEAFRNKILNDFDALVNNPEIITMRISRAEDREKVLKDIRRIFNDVFDQKSLLAGTEILIAVMNELSTGVKKTFRFARAGQVGWISGFIAERLLAMRDNQRNN